MTKQVRQLLLTLAIASLLLAICIVLLPSGLHANDGLSYYGSTWLTLVPFAAAMLIYDYSLWHLAKIMGHSKKGHIIAISMKIMAILVISVLITPIHFVEDFHSLLALILFLVQMGLSLRLLSWRPHWFDGMLVAVQALSFLIGLYFVDYEYGPLLYCQIAFQAAFWIQFIRALSTLQKQRNGVQ